MEKDYFELNIEYNIETKKFTTSGDIDREGESTLVQNFLRSRVGADADNREANNQCIYNINLRLHPFDDIIEAYSDTGNNALRDGLLISFLKSLDE